MSSDRLLGLALYAVSFFLGTVAAGRIADHLATPLLAVALPLALLWAAALAAGLRRNVTLSHVKRGIFAAVALLLAAIGLYGVMAFAVANRRRELSIRIALGAARTDIMQLIFRHGGRLLLIGLGIGLLAGIGAARFAASLMAEVTAADPVVFLIAPLVLGFVAFMACWIPARRATKVDPISALRAE